MRIEILDRNQVERIDLGQWQQLARTSQAQNPFYESWALLPALKHLYPDAKVYVVTAYVGKELVALFPVEVMQYWKKFRYIRTFAEEHFLLTDPLCNSVGLMPKIVELVMKRLGTFAFHIKKHTPFSFGLQVHEKSKITQSHRGYVANIERIADNFKKMPSKKRIENNRIVNRALNIFGAEYVTSEAKDANDWFAAYCELEQRGWKGKGGSALGCEKPVTQYFKELVSGAAATGQVEFQALKKDQTFLAMTLRIISGNEAFEIKTTFNEDYRQLYPGVVLEILNLKHMSREPFRRVDSCTVSDNYVVNRLWPEQKLVFDSLYFNHNLLGYFGYWTYQMKRFYQSPKSKYTRTH